MTYCIIIRGPAGIGKTTIARRIATLLDGEYISVDDVLKAKGLDKIKGECIPVENFIKANELVIDIARKFLLQGSKVVIDGNFYHMEQLQHLIRAIDFDHYVFNLKASVNECIERDKDRFRPLGELSVRAVHSLVSRFSYGTIIDTTKKPMSDVVKEILGKLPI